MLNIGKLAGGAAGADYYLAKVASGVEDYYTGAGEAPGHWTGAGTAALGVSGEVTSEQLRAVLAGTDPTSGEALGRSGSGRRVPGFDLTFRAPKSVALLWALGDHDASGQVRAAHERAVTEALAYLEERACASRRGSGGHESVAGHGFVGAAFRHRTSRAGDPLLHTHVVVANAVQAVDDGKWRSLDARRLYTHAKTAGYLYQAVLRGELTRRLGLDWDPVDQGVADVAGMPRELIDAFSQRRAEITAHMADRGETSAAAAQTATLETRRAKDRDVDPEGLVEGWRARAAARGWDLQRVRQLCGPPRELAVVDETAFARAVEELAGPDGLTARRATFTRRDAIQAWAQRLPDGADRADIEGLADRLLADDTGIAVPLAPPSSQPEQPASDRAVAIVGERVGEPVAASLADSHTFRQAIEAGVAAGYTPDDLADRILAGDLAGARDVPAVLTARAQRLAHHTAPHQAIPDRTVLDESAVIRRRDGRVVAGDVDEARYSTPELLATERHAIQSALDRADQHIACATPQAIDAAIAARPGLSDEQQDMVRRLATSGAGVEVVVGKAGAGKTIALDAARAAWQTSGVRVVGAALAARAACELRDGAGIDAYTLDGLLSDSGPGRGGHGSPVPPGGVVVVDEAAMAGTRHLARLFDTAEQAGAKVVLVGDHRQLPEIDAGGIFRGLVNRLDPVELTTNRRQAHDWERAALDQLRHGDPGEAVREYHANDRLVVADTAEAARDKLVGDWWAARQHDGTQAGVMIAARTGDVDDLNARARARRHAVGELTGPTLTTPAGCEFAGGDEVVCLKNDRRLGVVNGTRGTITHVDPDQHRVTLRVDGTDEHVSLPGNYLAEHLTHGYALTGHKAQGLTTEQAWVLGSDELYREWGYVALSRARHQSRLYVVAGDEADDAHTHTGDHAHHPVAILAARLDRSRSQQLASDEAARSAAVAHARAELADAERTRQQARDQAAQVGAALTPQRHRQRAAANHETRQAADRVRRWQAHLTDLESTAEEPSSADRDTRRDDTAKREIAVDVDWATVRTRAQRAEFDPPAYLTHALGPRPDTPTDRHAWRQAVRAIETYRTAWHINDPHQALGDPPGDPRQRAHRDTARQTIDRLARGDLALDHARERDCDAELEADLV